MHASVTNPLFTYRYLPTQKCIYMQCDLLYSVFTYDLALSFLLLCVKCYIGPCGVLVPTGMVDSNNEFKFEFELYRGTDECSG